MDSVSKIEAGTSVNIKRTDGKLLKIIHIHFKVGKSTSKLVSNIYLSMKF